MKKRELKKWRETYTLWESPCLGEGLHLNCHFDEKDDVKSLGGRWSPDPSGKGGHWWMPKDRLNKDCPIECDIMDDGWSGTIEHWLTNHKMIAGQYGHLPPGRCEDAAAVALNPDVYELSGDVGDKLTISFYDDLQIVRLQGSAAGSSDQWVPVAEARHTWDMLMNGGYRLVISATSEV